MDHKPPTSKYLLAPSGSVTRWDCTLHDKSGVTDPRRAGILSLPARKVENTEKFFTAQDVK